MSAPGPRGRPGVIAAALIAILAACAAVLVFSPRTEDAATPPPFQSAPATPQAPSGGFGDLR